MSNLSHARQVNLQDLFGSKLPDSLAVDYSNRKILGTYSLKQIMEIIDFTPPFLKISDMVLFAGKDESLSNSSSIATGIISPRDTKGHYNESIFLSLCGGLMASSASIHLAIIFPETAPEVIEANGVKPIDKNIWKPAESGTRFWVESVIIKKKMNLVITYPKIYFGALPYAVVDELKLMLLDKKLVSNPNIFQTE